MASHRHHKKKNLLRVSLCDGKSCHKEGGGEHIKADIEDLVSLLPASVDTTPRVKLRTCLGHCNRAPNVLLESRGSVLLYTPTTRERHLEHQTEQTFVNDGGLRMRVVEPAEEDTDGGKYYATSHKLIVNHISVTKVAYNIGIWDQPEAVQGLEHKAAGNKALKAGNYTQALEHYTQGRAKFAGLTCSVDEKTNHSLSTLSASLWWCCTQCRVQWASATEETSQQFLLSPEMAQQELQTAIRDSLQILMQTKEWASSNTNLLQSNQTSDTATMHRVLGTLLETAEQMEIDFGVKQNDNEQPPPPIITDARILALLCVALADAWNALAKVQVDNDNDDDNDKKRTSVLQQGALKAYTAILEATEDTKLLRLKERRPMKRALEALQESNSTTTTTTTEDS